MADKSAADPPRLIAVDWGSTTARAYLLDAAGNCQQARTDLLGVKHVAGRDFEGALGELCGAWLRAYPELPIYASGMVGSRNGWREAPYVICPADIGALARGVIAVDTAYGRPVHIVPGLRYTAPDGVHDVIRGEETEIYGALAPDAVGERIFLLPGTHSKWVIVHDDAIVSFMTFMTGELFDLLRRYSLLGDLMPREHADRHASCVGDPMFDDGLEHGMNDDAAILARLFSVRTRGLVDGVTGVALEAYLSGLLIGGEIRAGTVILKRRGVAIPHVTLVGDPALCAGYRLGLTRRGIAADVHHGPAAARGLWRIAKHAAALPNDHIGPAR